MNNEFDFLCDTMLHVSEVQENLEVIASELRKRGFAHDRTKFQQLEFDAFVSTREDFKKANYGTKEYQDVCDAVRPAIDHHHSNNRHHQEFHVRFVCSECGFEHEVWPHFCEECGCASYQTVSVGIDGMTLIDLIEMLCDWKAAERRNPDVRLKDTIEYSLKKNEITGQLRVIIMNSLKKLNWI